MFAIITLFIWNGQLLLPPQTVLRKRNVFTPVCHSVHCVLGGVSTCTCSGGVHPYSPPRNGHWSGWYASYWNASLFAIHLENSYVDTGQEMAVTSLFSKRKILLASAKIWPWCVCGSSDVEVCTRLLLLSLGIPRHDGRTKVYTSVLLNLSAIVNGQSI